MRGSNEYTVEPVDQSSHVLRTRGSRTVEADAAVTPISSHPERATSHYLARRLLLAFHDLGLMRAVPDGWLQPGPDGVAFRTLTVREADKLVLAVEDLGNGSRRHVSGPGPNQPTLF
jgi:hypothetical protein